MEPLAKLFGSAARLKLLRLFLFNKDTAFNLKEITSRSKLSKEITRKELLEMTTLGLLKKKGSRATARYQTNAKFEHLNALDVFIRETTNVRPEDMLSKLRRSGSLRLVVLSGLFMGIDEPQIDILIVGDNLDERILAQAIRTLEAELGREIRYASFPTPDFRYRQGVYDRLLRDVFDYPHRLLIDHIGL